MCALVQSRAGRWYTSIMVIETVPQFIFVTFMMWSAWSAGRKLQNFIDSDS